MDDIKRFFSKEQNITIILIVVSVLLAFSMAINFTGGLFKQVNAGKDGRDGANGKSAYELAVEKGYFGSQTEWLASLKGEAGVDGSDGVDGKDGLNGKDGKSVYQLAVEHGYTGTEEEWLASLKGEAGVDGKDGLNGKDGKSVYQLAVEHGYTGTEEEWLASLQAFSNEVEETVVIDLAELNDKVNAIYAAMLANGMITETEEKITYPYTPDIEFGSLDTATGAEIDTAMQLRTVDMIAVTEGTTYSFAVTKEWYVLFYDASGAYLQTAGATNIQNGSEVSVPTGSAYMRLGCKDTFSLNESITISPLGGQ